MAAPTEFAYYDDGGGKGERRKGWTVYCINKPVGGPYERLSEALAAHPEAVKAAHARGPE